MDTEEHYDTPWEFKNKAIAAVLGGGVVSNGSSGNGQLSRSPKATDENFFENDLTSPTQPNSYPTKKSSPLQLCPVQQSSSQHTSDNYLINDNNRKTKQNIRASQDQPTQRRSSPHQRRFSTTSCESRQNQASQLFSKQKDRSRLSFERIVKPVLNPSSRVPYISNSPQSPGPSSAQWSEQPVNSTIVYPLVGKMYYEKEPKMSFIERNGLEFFQPSHSRRSTTFDEVSMVHEDGVLHIKLEMRDALWVLGEGPKFSSISGMLRCYKKNELPVRGAEHVRLKSPLTTAEVAMVMQSTRRKSQSP
uniref:SH2 domain-containing protein n=1 Tax=Ditylenchus dipsaci TaxID=166011 RepID=A0A915CQ14_9BILA